MSQTFSNPPLPFQIVQQVDTRMVPSGTISIAAGKSVLVYGSNGRQNRVFVVITNLDLQILLKVQSTGGLNGLTVFPQTNIILSSSFDFVLFNPDPTNAINVEVGEFYPDTGNLNTIPQFQRPGAGPAGGAASGGAPGGGGGGGGYPGGSGGGTQPR